MSVHVFAGPSLAGSPVLELPGVCAHPPIAHGDLYRVRLGAGDAVLIVDGLYQHRAPVRHKEILELLAAGVPVFGAASIGALRACELSGHGMAGLGTVYGWYAEGRLVSDADVALVHGDGDVGFRAFTHALVSLLRVADGLDPALAERIMTVARSVHFSERSDRALLVAARAAGLEPEMRGVLRTVAAPDGDVKRTDAEAAVRTVLAGAGRPGPTGPIPDTSYRREWRLHHTPAGGGPDGPTARQVLAYAQLFRPDYPDLHTRYVLGRLRPEHPLVGAGGREPRWLAGLTPDELVRRGLLTRDEATGLDAGQRAIRVLVRSFRLRSGRCVYEEIPAELRPDLPTLTGQCARLLGLTERAMLTNPSFHPADLPAESVASAFAPLWRVTDLPTALLDRGFRDIEDFLVQARPFYVAARAAVAMAGPEGARA